MHTPTIRKWVNYALDNRMTETDVDAAILFLKSAQMRRDLEGLPIALKACDYSQERIDAIMADVRQRMDAIVWPCALSAPPNKDER